MPSTPHPRQQEFRALDCEEALFGGAAGGGKTRCLIDWLGEGVDIPGYTGIFFRRTFPMLHGSMGAPIEISHEVYRPLGGVYNESKHCWSFPAGSKIIFSGMQHETDKADHQGKPYHRVAFDELTHFSETQYEYLFSRMRKFAGYPIRCAVRSSANPGGSGHAWVKQRFITKEAEALCQSLDWREPSPPGTIFWPAEDRAFVPSRIADNPSLDVEDYAERMLGHLRPVLRAQLLNGDWTVQEDAQIRVEWLRYYDYLGELLRLRDANDAIRITTDQREHKTFLTADTAGTSEEKAREAKGRPPSWSVIAAWKAVVFGGQRYLVLLDVWRERVAFTDLCDAFRMMKRKHCPSEIYCENAHFGPAIASQLRGEMTIRLVSVKPPTMPGAKEAHAKLQRASKLLNMLSEGRVFLPKGNTGWLSKLETEWLSWTGHPDETADQIDVASHAVNHLQSIAGQGQTIDVSAFRSQFARRGVV